MSVTAPGRIGGRAEPLARYLGLRPGLITNLLAAEHLSGLHGEGVPRLEAWLQANRDETGRRLIDGVIAEVLEHCGAARPRDDMTLMCLGRSR